MTEWHALLFTDAVDSTRLTEELGDAAASALWGEHDRVAREVLSAWNGREIDKSDGFLLTFPTVTDAVGFAAALHRRLAELSPLIRSRAGVHYCSMIVRQNPPMAVALGSKSLELDGVGKAVAARIMALALGGQTLLSRQAHDALCLQEGWRSVSHGHWRMKGLTDPIEVFEVGSNTALFTPPPDSTKSYRVRFEEGGWKPVGAIRHGLPAERDGFVGRENPLKELALQFDGGARLVSVLGMGGIGKTRLTLRYAHAWLGSYAGGAWFCDLSSARSRDGIVHAVAQGLEVPIGAGDAVRQVGLAIAGRGECLVILDNFEQVARHAEETLGQWMQLAPQARFLVTSREVLGIAGERTHSLAPLTVSEAVSLFRRRARDAWSDFVDRGSDLEIVKSLVELLDCLPLAIELAASRVRVMPVNAMLARMSERFKLLARLGGRTDRQATLRATLDWSWELLSAPERSTLAQLSVFKGGWTLEAAEAIVDVSQYLGHLWVPDLLQALVEKSLVRRTALDRFDLLRTVRDYATEQLDKLPPSSSMAGLDERHWRYFASIPEPGSTTGAFADIENLVVALSRSAHACAWDAAVELFVRCSAALLLTGPPSAVVALAEHVVGESALTDTQRAAVYRAVGNAHYLSGQTQLADRFFEEGLAMAAASNDEVQAIRLRCAIAEVRIRLGEHQQAIDLLQTALANIDRLANPQVEYLVRNRLGVALSEFGRFEEGQAELERSLRITRELDHRRWEGGVLGNLGLTLYSMGRSDEAARAFRESIEIARVSGDRQWAANAQCNLAFLLLETGSADEARIEFEAVLAVSREIGHRTLTATALCNLGLALSASSRDREATERLGEAVELAAHIGARRLEAESRRHLAEAWLRLGERAQAIWNADIALTLASELNWEAEVSEATRLKQQIASSWPEPHAAKAP